jgi:hypothetical protein
MKKNFYLDSVYKAKPRQLRRLLITYIFASVDYFIFLFKGVKKRFEKQPFCPFFCLGPFS